MTITRSTIENSIYQGSTTIDFKNGFDIKAKLSTNKIGYNYFFEIVLTNSNNYEVYPKVRFRKKLENINNYDLDIIGKKITKEIKKIIKREFKVKYQKRH